mmetsp:Transcript_5547/g.8530  ORF Transcript_5547/g.8530 Transcript_5547/m.8530 type:complete len:199 (-) Transcript_5547:167-763(-)
MPNDSWYQQQLVAVRHNQEPSRNSKLYSTKPFLNSFETKSMLWFPRRFCKKKKKMIVLQRRMRGPRLLLNHDELRDRLVEEFDDCCTVTEFRGNETMNETAALHHYADVVVGPHGAGLINLLFSKPTTKLVEMHPKYVNNWVAEPNLCFQKLVRATGMESKMLFEDCDDDVCQVRNFTIPITPVVEAVRELLERDNLF